MFSIFSSLCKAVGTCHPIASPGRRCEVRSLSAQAPVIWRGFVALCCDGTLCWLVCSALYEHVAGVIPSTV